MITSEGEGSEMNKIVLFEILLESKSCSTHVAGVLFVRLVQVRVSSEGLLSGVRLSTARVTALEGKLFGVFTDLVHLLGGCS